MVSDAAVCYNEEKHDVMNTYIYTHMYIYLYTYICIYICCNRNQCATSECWSRKWYARLAGRKIKRDEQIRSMPAIKDKETGKRRELTGEEKERIVNNIDEARGRRLRKLKIAENKARAEKMRKSTRRSPSWWANEVRKPRAGKRTRTRRKKTQKEAKSTRKRKLANEGSEIKHEWERQRLKEKQTKVRGKRKEAKA